VTLDTIAVFHGGASNVCAWTCADGIVSTLSAMGYGVIDCIRPSRKDISIELLEHADLIILSGPEHFHYEIDQKYGAQWHKLRSRKAIWYSESTHRDDREFDFGSVNQLADLQYYPALQDAEEFGGHWLPFGADIKKFKPRNLLRENAAGFSGNLYPKRIEFLRRIDAQLKHVQAAQHRLPSRSVELLADAYNSTSIFVNLPALSRLLVTRVTEVMACRTMLITPKPDHQSALPNMNQFIDGKHLVYYDAEKPSQLGELIRYYLAHESEADSIAEAGWVEVSRSHTLEARLRKIIADVQFDAGGLARLDMGILKRATMTPHLALVTHWGTVAYYDDATRTIRHALPADAPKNLFLQSDGLRARLVCVSHNLTNPRQLYFDPKVDWAEPGLTQGTVCLYDRRAAFDCDLEFKGGQVSIRHANNYLSADRDGMVRNDRSWLGEWELFELKVL
jgi:hypothetical protein